MARLVGALLKVLVLFAWRNWPTARPVVGALLMVLVLYAVLMGFFPYAFTMENHQLLAGRLGFYGVLTVGVGMLIASGGIDLSIGSLVGLSAVIFGTLIEKKITQGVSDETVLVSRLELASAAGGVILGSALIGMAHGLLITKLRLQPFLVTLCGLFMYRGLARWLRNDTSISIRDTDTGWIRSLLITGRTAGISHELLLLMVIALICGVLLHGTVVGRYWYAIGYNEQAARYAGISTDRYKILAYVLCSTLAGLGGVLFMLDYRNALPSSAGSLLELYAITGAVLGGCSLRGGEGAIVGMILGAAVLPLLQQICNFSPYIGSTLEYTVIGGALLLATIGNELITRWPWRK